MSAASLLGLPACNLHQDGVMPPDNRIFFPGGALVENDGRLLYVVNSNSDLRYNAGTLVAVDLGRVRQDDPRDPLYQPQTPSGSWPACSTDSRYVPPPDVPPDQRCCWDVLDSNILNCDEQIYIKRESSVRIGNFGGMPVMQQLPPGDCAQDGASGRRRMFMPIRGDNSIAMFDVAVENGTPKFSCTGDRPGPNPAQERFAVCDPQWVISRADDPVNLAGAAAPPADQVIQIPAEPYALAVDDAAQLLYVGHLRGGGVSLIDLGLGCDMRTPDLVQIASGVLPPDANGSIGITSLTLEKPNCLGTVYVSSRFRPVVSSFTVFGLGPATCSVGLLPGPGDQGTRSIAVVGTGDVLSTGLSGSETRGIEFVRRAASADPDSAFIVQRTPPALVGLDLPSRTPFAVLEVCQGPTNMIQQRDALGKTLSLLITCFDSGEIYVIDPWVPRVAAVIPVGRGPVATVLPPPAVDPTAPAANRGYVVAFGGNNLAVVDLDPASPTLYRVIQRIGFTSAVPREVSAQ